MPHNVSLFRPDALAKLNYNCFIFNRLKLPQGELPDPERSSYRVTFSAPAITPLVLVTGGIDAANRLLVFTYLTADTADAPRGGRLEIFLR